MSFTKTYFLCLTSDFIHPPLAGPLCLSAILRSMLALQFPLNRANIVLVANANSSVVETNWKKTISAKTGFGLDVYMQFLQLAIGSEVGVEHSSQTASTFAFDTVTTVSFEPTPQYVNEAVKAPAVQAYLREPKQRFTPVVSLFLVTGMKLVKGAKIRYLTLGSTAVTGNFGIDVALLVITFGPKGRWTRTNNAKTEFNQDSEFVFVFCVKRLRFGQKVKTGEYNKGAFLTIGKGEINNETEPVLVDNIDSFDIENARLVPNVAKNSNVYCIPA